MNCVCDALDGTIKLELGLPRRGPGIWSAGALPPGVFLTPPCWIGPGAVIGAGAKLGPWAVVGRGAEVGPKAVLRRSVLLEGASAGPGAALSGAILCPGAAAGQGNAPVDNIGGKLGRGLL